MLWVLKHDRGNRFWAEQRILLPKLNHIPSKCSFLTNMKSHWLPHRSMISHDWTISIWPAHNCYESLGSKTQIDLAVIQQTFRLLHTHFSGWPLTSAILPLIKHFKRILTTLQGCFLGGDAITFSIFGRKSKLLLDVVQGRLSEAMKGM